MKHFIAVVSHGERTYVYIFLNAEEAINRADQKLTEIRYLYPYDLVVIQIFTAILTHLIVSED